MPQSRKTADMTRTRKTPCNGNSSARGTRTKPRTGPGHLPRQVSAHAHGRSYRPRRRSIGIRNRFVACKQLQKQIQSLTIHQPLQKDHSQYGEEGRPWVPEQYQRKGREKSFLSLFRRGRPKKGRERSYRGKQHREPHEHEPHITQYQHPREVFPQAAPAVEIDPEKRNSKLARKEQRSVGEGRNEKRLHSQYDKRSR